SGVTSTGALHRLSTTWVTVGLYLFYQCFCGRRHLHSFPTRRSSDLVTPRPAEQAHGKFGAAGAHQAGNPHHLAPPHVKVDVARRSEEHTSELQSRGHLVCRLLLEKKKII